MKADERETGRTSIYIYIEFAEYVVQWTHRRFNVGTWKRNVKPSIKRIYVTSTTNNRDFSFPFREREFCTSSSARFTASSDRIIPLSLRFFLNPRNFPFHSLLLSISERLTDIILFLRSLFYFFFLFFFLSLWIRPIYVFASWKFRSPFRSFFISVEKPFLTSVRQS